ncbi:unnamed protein product [Microthlaspi erraticum]|uniref:Uncharacterized protein n=1 Tax=Microthlaspi erraticum TaxID=1685480 RepID=A0A6D2JZI0_9BRAS|nr:unnamed protein product [Microthlaspi erraticum]
MENQQEQVVELFEKGKQAYLNRDYTACENIVAQIKQDSFGYEVYRVDNFWDEDDIEDAYYEDEEKEEDGEPVIETHLRKSSRLNKQVVEVPISDHTQNIILLQGQRGGSACISLWCGFPEIGSNRSLITPFLIAWRVSVASLASLSKTDFHKSSILDSIVSLANLFASETYFAALEQLLLVTHNRRS